MTKRIIFSLLLIIVVGGAAYYFWNQQNQQQTAGDVGLQQQQLPPPPVSVMTVGTETIRQTESLPARVAAFRQAEIRPQVSGIITQRLFEEGSNVEKGQQLYQIDDAPYRAALASAEADLKSAQANVTSIKAKTDRYKGLVDINAVSKQEYEDLKAQLAQAEAAIAVAQAKIDVAKVDLDYTKVYAPISGRIGKSVMTEGALVSANQTQPLATITQLHPVYVDMTQPSAEAMKLRAKVSTGERVPVAVVIDEASGLTHPHKGELKFSDVIVNETTGSISLRAVVPNPDHNLLPGLFVRAVLDTGEEQAVLIPQRATVRNPQGQLRVWVVDGSSAVTPRIVTAREAYGDQWVITEGIKPGERIIVEGYQKVSPGATVSASPWNPAEAGTDSQG